MARTQAQSSAPEYFDGDENIPDVPDEIARLHEALPALGNFISAVTRRGWKVRGINRYHECLGCGVLCYNWKSRLRHDKFHDELDEKLKEILAELMETVYLMQNKVDWMHEIFTREGREYSSTEEIEQ